MDLSRCFMDNHGHFDCASYNHSSYNSHHRADSAMTDAAVMITSINRDMRALVGCRS